MEPEPPLVLQIEDSSEARDASVEGRPDSDDDSSNSASSSADDEVWDLASTKRRSRLFRYVTDKWMEMTIPQSLLTDITNYPQPIKEDIWAAVTRTIEQDEESVAKFRGLLKVDDNLKELNGSSKVGNVLRMKLQEIFDLVEVDEPLVVKPDSILPRFLWHRMEMVKLYGEDSVHEPICELSASQRAKAARNIAGLTESRKDDCEDVAAEPAASTESVAVPTTDIDCVKSVDVIEESVAEAPSESTEALPSNPPILSKKRKKRVQVVQSGPLPDSVSDRVQVQGPSVVADRTDALSVAIRDLQFRLSRHGTLADPRSILGRGEMTYDPNDPLLDLEDELGELGVTREYLEPSSSNSGSDGEGGASESSEEDEYLDELYVDTADEFVLDNLSEASEAESEAATPAKPLALKESDKKKRVLVSFAFPKPTNLALVFNPRGWRQHRIKDLLPPPALLFFHTLEYILTAKRAHILAKEIYETFEFALVDTSVPSVSLNEVGERLVDPFIKHVLKAAFSTFLVPYAPATGIDGYPDLIVPRHARFLLPKIAEKPDYKAAFISGFLDADVDTPIIVAHVLKNCISPYAPDVDVCKVWWWIASASHTMRVFAEKEETVLGELEEFFVKHAEIDWREMVAKVKRWTESREQSENNSGDASVEEVSKDVASDEDAFQIFEALQKTFVNYVTAFNLRRNVIRDIGDSNLWKLARAVYRPADISLVDTLGDRAALEKLLGVSWTPSMQALLGETSQRITGVVFEPSMMWLESRLKMYRKRLRITTMYEKRRPRSGQLNSLINDFGQTIKLTAKRKRETQGEDKMVSGPGGDGVPAAKRKRLTGSRRVGAGTDSCGREVNIVAALLKYYSLQHLITILQTSPFTAPLTLHCKVQHADQSGVKEELYELLEIEEWRSVRLRRIDKSVSFSSLEEAVRDAECVGGGEGVRGVCVSESGVRVGGSESERWMRAWQVFHVDIKLGGEASPLRVNLLDVLLMSYWLECLSFGSDALRPAPTVALKCVLSGGESERNLMLPEWMSLSVWLNRRECCRTGAAWDRFAVGQLIFLATWRKHMIDASHHLRPRFGLPCQTI